MRVAVKKQYEKRDDEDNDSNLGAHAPTPWKAGEPLLALPRAGGDELRLVIDEYCGCPYVGVRVWFRAAEGMRPGKAGLTFRRAELPAIIDALRVAAKQLGVDVEDAAPVSDSRARGGER